MKQPAGVLVGRALIRFLLLAIVIRLVRDTSLRMMYPFLPEYARGLGITLTTMGSLLMVRTGLVMLAPYFGNLADRHGPRPLLLVGIALQGIGLVSFSYANSLVAGLAAIIVLGFSDSLFHPLMQAYVGEHAPSARRGWALATVEYSWAITGIAILPIVGWLIAGYGWQIPFRLLSAGSLLSLAILAFLLPADTPRRQRIPVTLRTNATDILRDRSAAASLLANAAVFMAAETFFVVWGAHLERNFALGPRQIGQAAAIFGVAELGGSILASLIIDRVGKRRGVLAGVLFFLGVLLFLPWLNRSLPSLLVGLALVSISIEYSIVCTIPLLADQRPGSRATMLAMGAMAGASIRSITDTVAAWIFENGGFLITVAYAFAALLVAAWALWRWVEERSE